MAMSKQDKKFREIGARLVETCATCMHEHFGHCLKHEIQFIASTTHMFFVCNDYDGVSIQDLEQITIGVSKIVPMDRTYERHWTTCPHCKWEGWHGFLIRHEMMAGGDYENPILTATDHCPKCKNVVE